MTNFAPYANYGYLALIKEATAGTVIVPTEFLRLLSESIETNFGIANVQEIAGSRERNIRSVQNQIEVGGDIEFYVEPKMIGHFFRGLFGIPITQVLTAGVAFRHTFEVTDTPQTYTMDMKPADAPWIHRYFGVQITALNFEQDDNKIKCTATIAPRKAFINARVDIEVSSGTTLTVDQTAGITDADTILVLDKADGFTTLAELTITSVDSDTQLTVSTIGVTLEQEDIVVIKKSTAIYDQDKVMTWLGGSEISTGADIDNTSLEDKENFTLAYVNEVEARYFAGCTEAARFPGDVLVKGFAATGSVDKFYDAESNLDKLRKNTSIGLRLRSKAESAIEANSAIKASSTWGATANGFKVEASAAGRAGNDISVTLIINTSDTLTVTKTGNTILVKLADTTSSNNTGTLIATAIDALTGVDGTAEGTGAEEFTAVEVSQNLGYRVLLNVLTGTNVVGRDASEVSSLQYDHAAAKFDTFSPSGAEDEILMEEIPMTFFMDVESGDTSKEWSARILLVNEVSSY